MAQPNTISTLVTTKVRNTLVILVPTKFGLFGEVIDLESSIKSELNDSPDITQLVLDFARTEGLEPGFPSRLERIIKNLEASSACIATFWQNASYDIECMLETVDFGQGGEIDVPVVLTSELLGPDAMTSETRLAQDDVDAMLASLGLDDIK